MSGHSKWNNIKRKKGASDAAKAKVFTKVAREMSVAVKEGGADPDTNGKLRDCIAKAKAANMPNENIERCIKKAAGSEDKNSYEEMVYEGYGPNGVAVIIESLTDNRNRTAGDLRHYFDKCGGNLGQNGCVSYLFTKKGQLVIDNSEGELDEEKVMEDCFDAGAEDGKRHIIAHIVRLIFEMTNEFSFKPIFFKQIEGGKEYTNAAYEFQNFIIIVTIN